MSKVLLELASLDSSAAVAANPFIPIYHAVNPCACSWSDFVPTVSSALGADVKVVTWNEWLTDLRASADEDDITKNAGIKLLDFYNNVDASHAAGLEAPIFQTKETVTISRTLKETGPVTAEWMELWMRQWKS